MQDLAAGIFPGMKKLQHNWGGLVLVDFSSSCEIYHNCFMKEKMQQSNSVGFIWPNYAMFFCDEKESIPQMKYFQNSDVDFYGNMEIYLRDLPPAGSCQIGG